MAEFRRSLVEERFFELRGEYGEIVPDGGIQTLTVTAGRHTNTVKIHFLGNWVLTDKAKLREPSRAVRLLVLLRGWFKEPEAADGRDYYRRFLDPANE